MSRFTITPPSNHPVAPRTTPFDDSPDAYINDREPEIGMGVTVLGWGGTFAGTIIQINDRKTRITVQRDAVVQSDSEGTTIHTFEPNTEAFKSVFTKRPGGAWVRKGRRIGTGVTELWIGVRRENYGHIIA
jgi:hypothetical protein